MSKKKKGFINVVEMVTVVIILFIAFSIFFPGFVYRSRWNDAYIVLLGRDTLLTIDRIGKLYNYSFSADNLQRYLDTALPTAKTNLIGYSEVEGAVKPRLTIACNCTEAQISTLSEWFAGMKINGRDMLVFLPRSTLAPINQPADVLLIWGRKDLTPYVSNMRNFLAGENGIVEIADFTDVAQVNSAQQQIFGIRGNAILSSDEINDGFPRKPANSADILYGPYKYFYHVPLPLKTIQNLTAAVPADVGTIVNGCANFTQGNITLRRIKYKFWDCSPVISVYFDTNGNDLADTRLFIGQNFNITGYNLTLNYIDGLDEIGVSFRPAYTLEDFGNIDTGTQIADIQPVDGNANRVALTSSPSSIPVVILNGTSTSTGRTAWIADFSENGYGDDERQLLVSLLLYASNKKATGVLSPSIRVGFLTSYINAENQDMFEIYRFNLGLGFPFGR